MQFGALGRSLVAVLLGAVLGARAAPYDPPYELAVDTRTPAQAWLPQVLPAGARLLHGPVTLPFGAHAEGRLLAFRTADPPGGYAVWYLAAQPGAAAVQRLIRLRDPGPADEDIDVQVRAAFNMGPALARDIVLLETYSRAAPAGGRAQDGGTVFRRIGSGAEALPALAPRLDGVADAAQARTRLASAYTGLLPQVPGHLSMLFAALPEQYVDLTALERLQRLQRGHPAFKTYDPGQGFLETRGDAGRPAYVAALFRHEGGGWLLALQRRHAETQDTWFLRPPAQAAGAWQDVSAAVMPGYRVDAPYALPHTGRSVELGGGGRWTWTGQRFEAR